MLLDEKQVEIKDAIKVISSLNASQKLLEPEVHKLVKLILLVPYTNALSERSCPKLHRPKTYIRSLLFHLRTDNSAHSHILPIYFIYIQRYIYMYVYICNILYVLHIYIYILYVLHIYYIYIYIRYTYEFFIIY